MKFHVYYKDVSIGWSKLEKGDPPLGVAFGRFVPTKEYEKIQELAQNLIDLQTQEKEFSAKEAKKIEKSYEKLDLKIKPNNGDFLSPTEGILIQDFSHLLDPEDIEVEVLGLVQEEYKKYFSHHVAK